MITLYRTEHIHIWFRGIQRLKNKKRSKRFVDKYTYEHIHVMYVCTPYIIYCLIFRHIFDKLNVFKVLYYRTITSKISQNDLQYIWENIPYMIRVPSSVP